ncbi:MAG: gamma carbonic anhydrase family protein [Porphyromonas sp.]|nr:gamma carbonic anhydrase family protein [Porphyromonas sp.]
MNKTVKNSLPNEDNTELTAHGGVVLSVRGFTPRFGKECFLAHGACVIGDVVMGDNCSVWFNAVIRGDVNSIRIGNNVNIQDGAVLHTFYGKSVIELGDYVSLGHNVTLHGAQVKDYALIGMGATVMDNAVVGEGAIVAAGSVVLANTQIPPHTLWAGVPARFVKEVEPHQSQEMNKRTAHYYTMYAQWFTHPERGVEHPEID